MILGNYARDLADEIERDYVSREEHKSECGSIIEAQHASSHHIIRKWAAEHGIPMREKRECITDWLNRNFARLPRYSGTNEPLAYGDTLRITYKGGKHDEGRLQGIHFNRGPIVILSFVGCDHERLIRYDPEQDTLELLCPADGAPDAEGHRTQVGDVVYFVEDNREMCVEGFEQGFAWCSYDGLKNAYNPQALTHRKPDSWDKFAADALDVMYHSAPAPSYDELKKRADALMERGATPC